MKSNARLKCFVTEDYIEFSSVRFFLLDVVYLRNELRNTFLRSIWTLFLACRESSSDPRTVKRQLER